MENYVDLLNPCPASSYGYNPDWKQLVNPKTCAPVVDKEYAWNPSLQDYVWSYHLKPNQDYTIKNPQKGSVIQNADFDGGNVCFGGGC